MDVLVYHNHLGPVQVWTLPSSGLPQTAYAPGGPFPRAASQVAAKGSALTWQQWAQELSSSLPYFDAFSTEPVPDGLSAQQALGLVRQRQAGKFLSG